MENESQGETKTYNNKFGGIHNCHIFNNPKSKFWINEKLAI